MISRLGVKCLIDERYKNSIEALTVALDLRKLEDATDENEKKLSATLHFLAWALTEDEQFEKAEECYRDTLELRLRLFDSESLEVAATKNDWGMLYFKQGYYNKAERLLREALYLRQSDSRADWGEVYESLATLGSNLRAQGSRRQLMEAEGLERVGAFLGS